MTYNLEQIRLISVPLRSALQAGGDDAVDKVALSKEEDDQDRQDIEN